jgi:hypothetical protein
MRALRCQVDFDDRVAALLDMEDVDLNVGEDGDRRLRRFEVAFALSARRRRADAG